MFEAAFEVAESSKAAAIVVVSNVPEFPDLPQNKKLVYVMRGKAPRLTKDHIYVKVPDVPLTRISRIKIAAFYCLSEGHIKNGDTIIFLTGIPGSRLLDTLVVREVSSESEMFSYFPEGKQLPQGVRAEVVERVVDIASHLGSEGREGRSVGALFIVGDSTKVLSLSRQIIRNPFKGYRKGERNILDKSLEETVKELAALDGAFIVEGDGTVETCGALIAASSEHPLPFGLGARHSAAAGITRVTRSVSVTVSESTGTVTIFRGGKILTQIETSRTARPAFEVAQDQAGNKRTEL